MGEPSVDWREVYLFGDYRLDVPGRRLTRAGEPLALPPKIFELLLVLVRRGDRAVSRAELMDAVWRDTVVEEGNLAWNIKELRRLLGAGGAATIETVRGFGYRLGPAVTLEALNAAAPAPAASFRDGRSTPRVDAPTALRGKTYWAVASAAALVALVAVVAGGGRRSAGLPSAGSPIVAVLPLVNLAERADRAWIATAVREVLSAELAVGERALLVPGDLIAEAIEDAGVPISGPLSSRSLARLRDVLGADWILTGSYLAAGDGGELRLDLQIQDAATGERLTAWGESGNLSSLLAMLARAGGRLRERLPGGESVLAGRAAGWEISNDALRLYASGLDHLRKLNPLQAKEQLELAISAAPEFALAHETLAEAYEQLGYARRARATAVRAGELALGLGREDRLRIEGRERALTERWPAAVETYRELAGLFPESLDYGLSLARSLSQAGRHEEARAELSRLASVLDGEHVDPRVDLERGWIERRAGDFGAMRAAGARAVELGRRRGASILVAEGLNLMAWADLTLGEYQRGEPECREMREIAATRAHGRLEAGGLALCAWMKAGRGDAAGAAADFETALQVARRYGGQAQVVGNLNALATLELGRGRIVAAERRAGEALLVAREAGHPENEANTLLLLADCARWRGELARAEELADEGLARARESGLATRISRLLAARGLVRLDRGDAAGALSLVLEARSALAPTTLAPSASLELAIGRARLATGDAAGARQAARLATEREPLASLLLELEAALTTGDRAALEDALGRLEASLEAGLAPSLAALRALGRGRALAAVGRVAEAEAELARLLAVPEWGELELVRLEARLALAGLAAGRGPGAADAELGRARAEARAARFGRPLGERL